MNSFGVNNDFEFDIEAIAGFSAVPFMLEMICQSTGMGFSAVARVTENRWITCAVLDKIAFGLEQGGELKIETTICNEIRQSHQRVVIDDVHADPFFSTHHTPAMYGFRSYISVPIILKDGSFFGTLCAIDPKPAKLNNPKTVMTFQLFANLIAMHLNAFGAAEINAFQLEEANKSSEQRRALADVLGAEANDCLTAIDAGLHTLQVMHVEDPERNTTHELVSNVHKIKGIIDKLLALP